MAVKSFYSTAKLRIVIFATIILFSFNASALGQSADSITNAKSEKELEFAKSILNAIDKRKNVPELLEKLFVSCLNAENLDSVSHLEEGYSCYLNALSGYLGIYLLSLSDQERENCWRKYAPKIKHIQNFAISHSPKLASLGNLAYNCELLSKGLLLSSSNRTQRAIYESGDEELIKLWQEIKSMQALIEEYKAYVAILESDAEYSAAKKAASQGKRHKLKKFIKEMESNQQKMDSIEAKNLEYEVNLGLLSAVYFPRQLNFTTTWKDISKELHSTQAAIEFVAQSDGDPDHTYYTALLIRADSENPQVIPLTDNGTLIKLLQNSDFDKLYQLLWQPIEKYIRGIDEVFISTSGLMNTVPFAGLKHGGKYMTDTYFVRNVLMTSDILRLKYDPVNSNSLSGDALFVGGADFGFSPNELARREGRSKPTPQSNLTRGQLDELMPTRGQGFDYLPWSKIEVKAIHRMLADRWWFAQVYTDDDADEGLVKAFASSHSPTLLHISTHGFYFGLPKRDIADFNASDLPSLESAAFKLSDNPLMRCGLLLAGANHVWSGKDPVDGIDDGILTGVEISNLNLSQTGLVVVSACNTGLGDIDYSEGVYGLQRAFRLAGAKSIMVSLWNIPDKETAEFMEAFYSSLSLGGNMLHAFRDAQAYMRRRYPDQPEVWAGFVLIE